MAHGTPDSPPAPSQVLMQILMGGWAMQAAGTLARLRIADALASGPASITSVAERARVDASALHRLLRAGAMLGLVKETAPKTYALSPVGELLRSDAPGSMRSLLDAETAPGHWLPWMRLDECVRRGTTQAREALGTDIWTYYAEHPDEGRTFSEGMSGLSAMAIDAVNAVYAPPAAKKVVDVGGAHGAFLAAILGKLPNAFGVLFDRPEVVATAASTLSAAGVAERVERASGDFLKAVPEGGDLYLLKHIVHDWSDAENLTILKNVRRAIAPGGHVVIVEMALPEDSSPSPATLLDLNMLVMLTGKERTTTEMNALLTQTGFRPTRVVPTPSPFVVVEAIAA